MALVNVAWVVCAIGLLFAFGPAVGISSVLQQDFARYAAAAFVIVGLYFLVSRKTHGRRREYESIERNLIA